MTTLLQHLLSQAKQKTNLNLIDEIRCISDGQKELREDFQVVKQEIHSFKKLMIEFDSKTSKAIEALSNKVDRNNDYEYEEFRGRGMNVDFDDDYYKNNIYYDQHVTLHLNNIQTINEDSNNEDYIGDNMNGGASSKSIVVWVHPFGSFTMDDDCFKEMGELREWMNEGRIPRNKKYPYIKKDNTLTPPFEFGKTTVNKKDWFHKFAFGGQSLESLIQSLYKKFIENNGGSDVVKPEHDIAKYILGEFVLSNMPWHTVDHILFPLCVDEKWVMTRNDIQLNNGPYKNRVLVDPFNVMMIKDLPSQEAADRGIYVALFAERFICGSNVVDNECDANTHHIKFGSLLWKYGKMKLEKHITSESESSGIKKIMDRVKRYSN
ncbi:hypothetical protein MTR67_043860 [Solanum verrucosum]|uniref:Uncharacterized protein n=1 Tax=Solanum verrucosum TaxID=315347 RepID=A0AAF0UR41_SOLVR|nr:hypothetical protein MTR67_043860 [Solanum verrucosum]